MYKALISFSGIVSMAGGEVREISDLSIAEDLLRAGYIEKVEDKPVAEEKPKAKPAKKKK